ncbi:Hypothetical predicted protein [Scomber scombrus]|uniref:Uncharacterized protein n=1 Tax=Scomber scombrus TaxID=13677 RepID=A0AAV1P1J9_SCOSC
MREKENKHRQYEMSHLLWKKGKTVYFGFRKDKHDTESRYRDNASVYRHKHIQTHTVFADALHQTVSVDRGERDKGRDTEGHEETDNMKASLDSRGFNLSQKAYPRTQINAGRCECHTYCTFGNEKR